MAPEYSTQRRTVWCRVTVALLDNCVHGAAELYRQGPLQMLQNAHCNGCMRAVDAGGATVARGLGTDGTGGGRGRGTSTGAGGRGHVNGRPLSSSSPASASMAWSSAKAAMSSVGLFRTFTLRMQTSRKANIFRV